MARPRPLFMAGNEQCFVGLPFLACRVNLVVNDRQVIGSLVPGPPVY